MKLRGVHSKSSSSTASMMAAIGVPNTVVMPAAAPATSSVLRSLSLTGSICAISEPMAPPVMMIGPSAPNGPPEPIEIADDSGFRIATLASSRRAPEQDRLDRLGNAVAADLLAAVARHQADDQRADHRHHHRGKPERRILQLQIGERELAEIGDVGGKPDQLQQRDAGKQRRRGDHHGYGGNGQHARVGREIPEMAGFRNDGASWLAFWRRPDLGYAARRRRRPALSARYVS